MEAEDGVGGLYGDFFGEWDFFLSFCGEPGVWLALDGRRNGGRRIGGGRRIAAGAGVD